MITIRVVGIVCPVGAGVGRRGTLIIVATAEAAHGAGLIERTLDELFADPRRLLRHRPLLDEPLLSGPPQPMRADVLADLSLPSGRPLAPSLRRWLAFDTSVLARSGWFASSRSRTFTPRPLLDIVETEWDAELAGYFAPLADRFDECFLLPGGSDSRLVLATGHSDSHGEYPVFVVDEDDQPLVELAYPGFDVYIAEVLGALRVRHFAKDPVYGDRMREHAERWFGGAMLVEYPFSG